MALTDEEIAYMRSQPLARVGGAVSSGTPIIGRPGAPLTGPAPRSPAATAKDPG
jgi:hypothetical protein